MHHAMIYDPERSEGIGESHQVHSTLIMIKKIKMIILDRTENLILFISRLSEIKEIDKRKLESVLKFARDAALAL